MDVSARSFLASAIAAVSAATLTITPSVMPTVARLADPAAVQLTSAVQLFSPDLLDSASAAAGSLGADVEALYNAVEPWVAYEVNFLSWAVGWVPVAGLLAPQLIFGYDLGQPIVESLLFNTVDFLSGTISFAEALSNIGTATTDAFNAFVNTETDWIDSMLPPLPPIGAGSTGLVDLMGGAPELGALADVGTLFGFIP